MLRYDPKSEAGAVGHPLATDPATSYFPEPGLRDAVNVALMLRRPLLLTGPPGSGKTALAGSVAHALGLGPPLVFITKSNSQASDLFYFYDAMRRFQARETGQHAEAIDYFAFNALGLALLYANAPDAVAGLLPNGLRHPGQQQSVVLIDEVDKAPRDFPNDLLDELDRMRFRIPELGAVEVCAPDGLRPIVIVTSNSEKDLPDPFLRRCVYYHISEPTEERLIAIARARLGVEIQGLSRYLDAAVELFHYLTSPAVGLRRSPSTAELLDWLRALHGLFPDAEDPLRQPPAAVLESLGTLVKNQEDQARARECVDEWLRAHQAR